MLILVLDVEELVMALLKQCQQSIKSIYRTSLTVAINVTSSVSVSIVSLRSALFLYELDVLRDPVYEPLLHELRASYELCSTWQQPHLPYKGNEDHSGCEVTW